MLQDPISKPPNVQMEVPRGAGTDHNRKNKPSSGNSEQVIKCPRCDSLNTKFCYYNNYSLTQPRHFCKNCRRYWTQGGSLRNVPIGGGCRKNKRVKQRTVDPHMFGGLDDHSSFMQHAATGLAPGSLLSSSCFVGGPPGSGFVDLVNNPMSNDNHLLSMAFSRIQESLRLGTSDQQLPMGGARQFSLMMQQQQQQQHPTTALYDDAAGLDVSNGYVKPEHHHVQQMFNGSELFHEHPTSNPGVHLGMSLDEHQLCTNFGVQDAGPFSCAGNQGHQLAADAQLKLVQHQRQALALHLGAPSEHYMQNPTSCSTSTGGAGAVADDSCGIRSAHLQYVRDPPAERYMDFHHRHLALPDFEDQESPESMNSMIVRRGHVHAADRQLVKGSAMSNIGSSSCSAAHQERVESWQQISSSHTEQQQQQLLQFAGHGGARKAAVDDQAISTTPSSAGPHEQQAHNISNFWSPSPWSTNQDVHTSALL